MNGQEYTIVGTLIRPMSTIQLVEVKRKGERRTIAFDHRPFWHWLEASGLKVSELVGKKLRVSGEEFVDQTISLPYDGEGQGEDTEGGIQALVV